MSLLKRTRNNTELNWTSAILAGTFLMIVAWVILQHAPVREISGDAVAVDGDSLRIKGQRIRLLGLDAPEYEQTCQDRSGAVWPCGLRARDQMSALLGANKTVCTTSENDLYGRALATCTVDKRDIGAALVENGWAIIDGRYRAEQNRARNEKRGIWQGEFMPPAEWRAREGEEPEQPGQTIPGRRFWIRLFR